jgi:hypothetical protein
MEIEKSKADLRGEGEDNKSILPPIEIDEASILTFANRQWDDTGRDPNRRVSSFRPLLQCIQINTNALF